MIPVFIVTGFLGSGKSCTVNAQLKIRQMLGGTCVISCEEGHTPTVKTDIRWVPENLDAIDPENPDTYRSFSVQLTEYILRWHPKEIWIEWNGTIPFQKLESILYEPNLTTLIAIKHCLYIATDRFIASMVMPLGNAVQSQLYAADTVVLRQSSPELTKRAKSVIADYNPDASILTDPDSRDLDRKLNRPVWPVIPYIMTALLTLYILLVTVFRHDIPYSIHHTLAIISGIILEAIPFLLLGTVGATLIRLCIPERTLLKYMGSDSASSYAMAMFGGLFLPVCDCAIIPLFKAFLDKKIPLHTATLFMLSAPIVNPVVLLSTWYAFPDQPEFTVIRVGAGLLVALFISWSFKRFPLNTKLTGTSLSSDGRSYIYTAALSPGTGETKGRTVLLHIEREFTQLLFYFAIAATVLAVFQVYIKPLILQSNLSMPVPLSVLLLLGLAFMFSLCSTSDAIIGKSLSAWFPQSSVLGFLVMGPMIDIKNVYILKQYVSSRFIARLGLTVMFASFITAMIYQGLTAPDDFTFLFR